MQTIAHPEKKVYTPEEYLEFEVNSEERHEYINGEIVPMTGGTPNHNKITGNFYAQSVEGVGTGALPLQNDDFPL